MARPRKKTLDFFMHDTSAHEDVKIRRLTRKHGAYGYAAYFVLLELLGKEDGMRLDLSDLMDLEVVVEKTHARDEAHLHQIIQDCVEARLFDRQLWEGERVVFSHGLYKRYVGRLEERRADAERKKHERAAKVLQDRILELEQKEKSETDLETDLDPEEKRSDPEEKRPELSENVQDCPAGQLEDNPPTPLVNQGLEGQEEIPNHAINSPAQVLSPATFLFDAVAWRMAYDANRPKKWAAAGSVTSPDRSACVKRAVDIADGDHAKALKMFEDALWYVNNCADPYWRNFEGSFNTPFVEGKISDRFQSWAEHAQALREQQASESSEQSTGLSLAQRLAAARRAS